MDLSQSIFLQSTARKKKRYGFFFNFCYFESYCIKNYRGTGTVSKACQCVFNNKTGHVENEYLSISMLTYDACAILKMKVVIEPGKQKLYMILCSKIA